MSGFRARVGDKLPVLLGAFVLLQPLLDLLTNLSIGAGMAFSPGMAVRAGFLVLALGYVVFFSSFPGKWRVLLCLGGVGAYFILFLALMFCLGGWALCLQNLRESGKVLFVPVVGAFLWAVWREHGVLVPRKALALAGGTYAGVILLAWLTGTGSPSYPSGFGNKGWFYSANEVGCILAVTVPVLLCLCLDRTGRPGAGVAAGVLSVAFAANWLGTKILFLAVFAYAFLAFLWCVHARRLPSALTALAALVVLLFLFRVSPLSGYLDGVYFDLMDLSSDALADRWKDGDGETGLWLRELIRSDPLVQRLDQILSRRLYVAAPAVEVYREGTLWTRLLGIGYGDTPAYAHTVTKAIELDGLNLLIRHGLLGFLLCWLPYGAAVVRLAVSAVRRPRYWLASLERATCLYAALLAFAVSCVAGHVLGAPAVSFFMLAVTMEALSHLPKKKEDAPG